MIETSTARASDLLRQIKSQRGYIPVGLWLYTAIGRGTQATFLRLIGIILRDRANTVGCSLEKNPQFPYEFLDDEKVGGERCSERVAKIAVLTSLDTDAQRECITSLKTDPDPPNTPLKQREICAP